MKIIENLLSESSNDISSIISDINKLSEDIRNIKKKIEHTDSSDLKHYKEFNTIKKNISSAENSIGAVVGSLFNFKMKF